MSDKTNAKEAKNESAPHFFVVIPVYEDVEAAGHLLKDIAALYRDRAQVIAVDDGSVRHPTERRIFDEAGLAGEIVFLKRNVGHQRALSIGLARAAALAKESDRIVLMDSDGEDRPASIGELLSRLDGTCDVVVATRKSRIESLKFKAFYRVYKAVFRLFAGRKISFGNFMAMTRDAALRLSAMQETAIHVAASVLASRLRLALLPIDRGARYAGRSKMNFVGLVLHGFKGLMIFAEDVLVRVGIASALVAALTVAGGLVAVGLKFAGFSTPGWFSLALGILVLMLIQTGALALMMLMLTGVIRSGTVTTDIDYEAFVARVEEIAGKPSRKTPEA